MQFAPTTRSRTLLFISYRDSTQRSSRPSKQTYENDVEHTDDEHALLMNASQLNDDASQRHLSLDMQLPPKWYASLKPCLFQFFPFSPRLLPITGWTFLIKYTKS
jgi:hypothetical protein